MRQLWILIVKQCAELRWVLLGCAAMVGLFLGLASYLFGTFGDVAMRDMTRISPQLLSGLLGGLTVGFDPLATWLATLLAHPLLLTLLTAAIVAIASRGVAGEVDRGTMDLLLSTPLARRLVVIGNALFLQLFIVLLVAIAGLAMWVGLSIGEIALPESLSAFAWVLVNLWALFTAVGGLCLLVSTCSDRQGNVIAIGISFVVVSFFVNLIASLWSLVRWADVVSVFHYYQPHPLVREGQVPWMHLGVLGALAVATHVLAVLVFERRDIAGP